MILIPLLRCYRLAYLSRVCGDDPEARLKLFRELEFVPRMRG